MVLREASWLLPAFKDKSQRSKELAIQYFTRSAGLTQRSAMHTAQKNVLETKANAKDFIAMMRDKIDGRNLDGIIYMDQTPVTFSYYSNKMLEIKGAKTINTIMSTSDMKCIILTATATTSRDSCHHTLFSKVSQIDGLHHGSPQHSLLRENMHARTGHGWMDEGMMHKCIDVVLRPWKEM